MSTLLFCDLCNSCFLERSAAVDHVLEYHETGDSTTRPQLDAVISSARVVWRCSPSGGQTCGCKNSFLQSQVQSIEQCELCQHSPAEHRRELISEN